MESLPIDDLLLDLRKAIGKRSVHVFVGAGVSIASTLDSPQNRIASWTGLLADGINRCTQVVPGLLPKWADNLRADIELGEVDGLLTVAERISRKLGAPNGGEYRRWLRDAFEHLKPTDTSILKALRDLRQPLATTNYDGLLEEIADLKPITWTDPGIERLLRGDEDRILHLHGYWAEPESVVLGIRSYEQLQNHKAFQAFLRTLITTRTLLFVGFGEGLADPNFQSFFDWTREVLYQSEYRHFRLCRQQEHASVQAQHTRAEHIIALPYGENYSDLTPFLRALVSDQTSPTLNSLPISSVSATLIDDLPEYRKRLRFAFSRWDASAVIPATRATNRMVDAPLDPLYLPLRLADISSYADSGKHLAPEEILSEQSPLAIHGPSGSGKTTFMRWTFRRLLENDQAAPIMIIVRDLASYWSTLRTSGSNRSLDAYIQQSIAEHIERAVALWHDLLNSKRPRLVLLIDGWDEIGQFGDELRGKILGLLARHPQIQLVITSRPHEPSLPSGREGFRHLSIQPLSPEEIEQFAARFFSYYTPEDVEAQGKNTTSFLEALNDLPTAMDLARTPSLLSMLLSISQVRPLPLKRHLLFEECIETLLLAQQRRGEQGAALHLDEWHPDDPEESLRVVAKLAYDMSWEWHTTPPASKEPVELLPNTWPLFRRRGFLRWLCHSVGLLTDQFNSRLWFANNSFQDFLTAWYLNSIVLSEDKRIEFFDWGASYGRGWEALRLWSALIARLNPAALEPILAHLNGGGPNSVILAGMLYADGLGADQGFGEWLTQAHQISLGERPRGTDESFIEAWRQNRNKDRRDALAKMWTERATGATWPTWCRLAFLSKVGGFSEPPESRDTLATVFQHCLRQESGTNVQSAALETLLGGIIPVSPNGTNVIGLLHVWPARRRLLGFRLRLAALCGFARGDLELLARRLMKESPSLDGAASLLGQPGLAYAEHTIELRDYFRDWMSQELPGSWSTKRSVDLRLGWLDEFWRVVWWRGQDEKLPASEIFEWVRWLWQHSRDYSAAETLASDLNVEVSESALLNFVLLDIAMPSRSTARAYLAHRFSLSSVPEIAVLSQACRYSLHPEQGPREFMKALQSSQDQIDPLVVALSRHIARGSSPEDRALLAHCAQNPEQYESPWTYGLQFIVRGDIFLGDGSILTLDELSDSLGLPRLPYLEPMHNDLPVKVAQAVS